MGCDAIAIFDFDGTITKSKWRYHLHEARSFDEFDSLIHRDKPNEKVTSMIRKLYGNMPVIVTTGKRESKLSLCVDWLIDNDVDYDEIITSRPDRNTQPTSIVKMANLDRLIEKYNPDLIFAFDDRKSVLVEYDKRSENIISFFIDNE